MLAAGGTRNKQAGLVLREQNQSIANTHTVSEKCLLTLPLNGWKPESRILETRLRLSGERGLFLGEAKWPFMGGCWKCGRIQAVAVKNKEGGVMATDVRFGL